MADNLTRAQRSYNMSRIRASRTKPELKIKDAMKQLGFTYQPKLYGRPDFADKKNKIAVFIDGCFWHKCPYHFEEPKSNRQYWQPKIARNVARRIEVKNKYREDGWIVIRIWEHELNNSEKIFETLKHERKNNKNPHK